MIKEEKCIICGSGDLTSVSAAIAPFIRIRCEIDEVLPDFRRLYCPACDFSFFNYRLSVEEVSSLYKGYRSKEYNELRTELEPDWISTCRSFADRSNSSHIARVNQLVSILKEWEIFPSMVLDYGGEEDAWLTRGAFPDAKVQNFDISYKSEQLDANVFDLVVCSYVLEHVSYPVKFIKEISEYVAPGGHLYIETPFEGRDLRSASIDGHPLNRMHEHISHFSPASLYRLMKVSGLTPIRIRISRTPYLNGTALIATKTPSNNLQDPIVEQCGDIDSPVLSPSMQRIHERAGQWIREKTRIVIHPAGTYAMELLAYTALKDAVVVALSDKNVDLHSKTLMGKRVIAPSSIPDLNAELVLIASPRYEDQISTELDWINRYGVRIVKTSEI